jgi:DNA-directed RNA polymerase subunit RPC12/RpoP
MPDDDKIWFFQKAGVLVGPCSDEEMLDFAAGGSITADTPVRHGSSGRWLKASDIEGLLGSGTDRAVSTRESGVIRFLCPRCGQKYAFNDLFEGERKARCKKCGAEFTVEAPPKTESGGLSGPGPEEGSTGPVVCPHCWHGFSQKDVLYISVHPSLIGDPVVGDQEQKRFLPAVFNARGLPLDAGGMECADMACPRCHLRIPPTVLDIPSVYYSIAGRSGSGKSYLLTAMTHALKEKLPSGFHMSFYDADPLMNDVLTQNESLLFKGQNKDVVVNIQKTQQIGDDFSNQVRINGLNIDLPKPFVFCMHPMPSHERASDSSLHRNVVFYDNAGEHFDPGLDRVNNPATKHLIKSSGIISLFDPAADAAMKRICDPADPQTLNASKIKSQDAFISELISRIRRHMNLRASKKSSIPFVMAVTKYDMWEKAFDRNIREIHASDVRHGFDMGAVLDISFSLRSLMMKIAPGAVNTAEAFFETVLYVPVSVFGSLAEMLPTAVSTEDSPGIRLSRMSPVWADIPMMTLLALNGFIPMKKEPAAPPGGKTPPPPPDCRVTGGVISFAHPSLGQVRLPSVYLGAVIHIDGEPYKLPAETAPGARKKDGDSFWD